MPQHQRPPPRFEQMTEEEKKKREEDEKQRSFNVLTHRAKHQLTEEIKSIIQKDVRKEIEKRGFTQMENQYQDYLVRQVRLLIRFQKMNF
jgi:hypothetical protein